MSVPITINECITDSDNEDRELTSEERLCVAIVVVNKDLTHVTGGRGLSVVYVIIVWLSTTNYQYR